MHITYASRDLTWTEPMQEWAVRQIAEPLARLLKTGKFDLSLYCQPSRPTPASEESGFEMWTVLQTYDGRTNRVVRCLGNDLNSLMNVWKEIYFSSLNSRP